MRRGRVRRMSIAIGIVFASAACSSTAQVDAQSAKAYAVSHVKARAGGGTGPSYYRGIDELLPNVKWVAPGSAPRPATDAVILGRISDVVEGKGFAVTDAAPNGTPVAFDDPAARWKTVHVKTAVERWIGSADSANQIVVAVAIDGTADFRKVAEGLKALDRVVLFLDRGSIDYDPALFSVFDNGRPIATVQDDRSLALPMVEQQESERLLKDAPTLDALIDHAGRPERSIVLVEQNGVLVRT